MEKPEFFVTPGYGEYMVKELHYSQAVKIGNRVETSGQGGWDDDLQIPESIEDEIVGKHGSATLPTILVRSRHY